MKKGDILTKVKGTSGFYGVGSQVEILEVGEDSIRIVHLPRNETALLGNDETSYGRNFLESNYKKV